MSGDYRFGTIGDSHFLLKYLPDGRFQNVVTGNLYSPAVTVANPVLFNFVRNIWKPILVRTAGWETTQLHLIVLQDAGWIYQRLSYPNESSPGDIITNVTLLEIQEDEQEMFPNLVYQYFRDNIGRPFLDLLNAWEDKITVYYNTVGRYLF